MKNCFFHHLLTLILMKNANMKHVNEYCKEIHKKI